MGDGKQLFDACRSSNPQEALQLVSSWDQQRIRDAAQKRSEGGYTPLHWACYWGHDNVVEMLLKHGADAKAKNDSGWTPLHLACAYGHVKVVEMLLKHGADANAKNKGGRTPLECGRHNGHGDKLEPVFAAHETRLSQSPAPLAPPTPAPPSAWLPPLPPTPTLETTASVVVAVDTWLRPLLPERTTSHPLPHLDAFISGAAKQNPNLATAVADIQRTIDKAPPEFPAMDWAAFQATTTQALGALDQALAAPEALNNRLGQLDPNTDNLESVLQALHNAAAGFELQPVLLELQTVLAACPAPPTTLTMAPETPPANLGAALDKVAMLRDVETNRIELFTNANSNLQQLAKALITALRAVARAGTTDTDHRVDTLEQSAQGLDLSAPPPAEALPEAWEELCQAHEKLSLPEQNGLEQLITWRAEHDYGHQDWYLAFALHEAQALVQQLQDMIDWQTTTLSVLTSCQSYADGITQSRTDQVVSIHEKVAELQNNIQATTAFLPLAPEEMRAGLEARLQTMKERLVILQRQLSDQTQVDQVAALAELLHQHFPALLVFLYPDQSALGARLRTVLGPDLPASLILEAMTEVDQGLTLSSLGQLSLQYNQNHKVYKARATLPNLSEQDLAVKEYALAEQHKQDQCRTFLRELRAMRQLEHPYIVPVLGALVDVRDGHPSAYLVQPWCTQGDLQQWLGRARHLATSTVVAGLMTQLRMALAFMHSKGLVHRDVKLSNVMLDGEEDQPVVRLGDFDIAKAAAEATMLPFTATALSGTAGYVAPEVLFGRGRVGARPAQDAFAFGCVLYNTYMFPRTVPPARSQTDEVVDQCRWSMHLEDLNCAFPQLATEMCDSTSQLYKETRALLATDQKQRPNLLSAGQILQQPAAQVGPAIDVLRDAPELIPEVAELLCQLSPDGRGLANIVVQRVERVQNPVLWERYSAKRREMLHRIDNNNHVAQLRTDDVDALPGQPVLHWDSPCQERLLLHGISADRALCDKVARLGFDKRFSGSNAGHRFGFGVYLTDNPAESHRFAMPCSEDNEHVLIITRALLGQTYVLDQGEIKLDRSSWLAPPLLQSAPSNERYDSVLATPACEHHEVIVFETEQLYPELFVHYKLEDRTDTSAKHAKRFVQPL
ncbi:uncharacterized protein MONBRDRAFT_39174 [Monosiga brevicollis MX1]|uniref:Protein kinase domain-containing protein n=1 Tax=Monosiga brevicollis TaxID=81824 RepID=A9VCP3_MONBE|nr:uncharacterized protein MONBRDRAFT_39174 [Monosiga brevicollis MX1]EDQ84722.1 predicted protein [Monosiga brevicollis MX1]|eukprot:XP_001750508.1 hypothetical protein [Monosiga brevicollis MX1]